MGAMDTPPGPGATDEEGSPISLATAQERLFEGSNCGHQRSHPMRWLETVDSFLSTICTGVTWKRESACARASESLSRLDCDGIGAILPPSRSLTLKP